jgi:diacylglycerol kinase family enzyme
MFDAQELTSHYQTQPHSRTLRCAAVLNANARGVNRKVHSTLLGILPPECVHLSRSEQEAEDIIARLIDSETDVIFAGGGDGTINQLINTLRRNLRDRGLPLMRGPLVGLLPLGTGNALSNYFKIGNPYADVGRLASGAPLKVQPLRMMQWNDELFPFAGMGVDGAILNDYIDLKRRAAGTPLQPLCTGLSGYMISLWSRSIPRALNPRIPMPNMRMWNSGRRAYRVDGDGRRIQAFEPGELMYEGRSLIAAASTILNYGFDLRLFPFADADSTRFHVRMYSGKVIVPASRIHRIFDGTFQAKGLHDFLADSVRLEMDEPAPFQLAGDARGWRESLTLQMSDETVPVALADVGTVH